MKEMWDKKAASYPRFTGAPSEFQTRLYAKIAEFGVKFDAKSLADIGCGTGVHTLLLAGMHNKNQSDSGHHQHCVYLKDTAT